MNPLEAFRDPGIRGNVYHCGDGFSYHINRQVDHGYGSKSYHLRCDMYSTTSGCQGRATVHVTLENTQWCNGVAQHNHAPDHLKHQQRLLRNDLMEACRTEEYRQPRQLINLHSARYPVEVAARLRNNNLRCSMQRARRKMYPLRPQTLRQLGRLLEDPVNVHLTASMDRTDTIYEATVGPPGERAVILISKRMKKVMRKAKEVFVDATFVPTPQHPKGSQVYQIVCLKGHNVIPLMQVIMERKTYTSYRSIFSYIRQHIPRFQPRVAHMDFENAQQKAWREVFPRCVVRGCYFHYLKAMLKHVKKLGLTRLLKRNVRARRIVRSFTAIPLLPHHLMKRGVMILLRQAMRQGVAQDLFHFFLYYIATWMFGFRYETLSVYNEMHRTNNACEAANRILRLETGPYHPNIWDFLNAIRRYEHAAYIDHYAITVRMNYFGRKRKTATLENDRAIANATADLLTGGLTIKSFLRRASTRCLNVFNGIVL